MSVTLVSDHAARALARLAGQLKQSVSHKGMLNALSEQTQECEDNAFDLLLTRQVEAATGATLDGIGDIVGMARQGRSDSDYRNFIKAQILINRRSGEIETLIEVVRLLIPSWAGASVVKLTEYTVSAYVLECTTSTGFTTSALAYQVWVIVKSATAAGVRPYLIYNTAATSAMFSLAGGPGLGFGAGQLAGVY